MSTDTARTRADMWATLFKDRDRATARQSHLKGAAAQREECIKLVAALVLKTGQDRSKFEAGMPNYWANEGRYLALQVVVRLLRAQQVTDK